MDNQLEKHQSSALDVNRFEPRNFADLMQYCAQVVESGLCPRDINKPADAMLIIQRGAELGLPTIAALQNLYVIESGGAKRIGMYADAAIGLVRRNPVCVDFQVVESTDDRAVCQTWRRGAKGAEGSSYATGKPFTYLMKDARTAGLGSKDTYKKHPRAMLLARCKMALARMVYEDILAGVYAREEFVEDAGEAEVVTGTFEDEPTQHMEPERDTGGGIDFTRRDWHEQTPKDEFWGDSLKWKQAVGQFDAISMNAGVKNGNLETFKRMLVDRHSVGQWDHMPPSLINRWSNYMQDKGENLRAWMLEKIEGQQAKESEPTPVDEEPNDGIVITEETGVVEEESELVPEEESDVMDADFEPVEEAEEIESFTDNEDWKHLMRSLKALLRFCEDVDDETQQEFFGALARSGGMPRIGHLEPVLLRDWVEQVKEADANDGSRDQFVRETIQEWA